MGSVSNASGMDLLKQSGEDESASTQTATFCFQALRLCFKGKLFTERQPTSNRQVDSSLEGLEHAGEGWDLRFFECAWELSPPMLGRDCRLGRFATSHVLGPLPQNTSRQGAEAPVLPSSFHPKVLNSNTVAPPSRKPHNDPANSRALHAPSKFH